VYAQHDAVALLEIVVHPLDLVGVQIWRGRLDGGGQVENDLGLGRGLPGLGHGVAHIQGEFRLGGAEDFRRVLIAPLGFGKARDVFLDELRTRHCNVLDFVFVHVEDDLAKGGSASVVQVHDGLFGAGRRFDGTADKVFARLGQHNNRDIVGNAIIFYQGTDKIEVGLRCRWKTDFDFLEAYLDELLEKPQLAGHAHGLDQGLVAVAQIGTHPDRRMGNAFAGPGSFREVAHKRDKRTVFV
jgi:hypothetical protein